MNFLEKIKENLSNRDFNRIEIDKYYEEINYNKENDYLYIRLKENQYKLDFNEFIIKDNEYNLMIYDLLENNQLSDIERFSINHIQFENEKSNYIISELIDRFFQFFIIYLENEYRIEKSKKYKKS